MATGPCVPADLRARWRDLPRHARLLQRRFGNPTGTARPANGEDRPRPAAEAARLRWFARCLVAPFGVAMWLALLLLWQTSGRLLAHGSAVMTVQGAQVSGRRRLAFGTAFAVISLALGLFAFKLDEVLQPLAAAAGAPGWLADRCGETLLQLALVVYLARSLYRMRQEKGALAVNRARAALRRSGGTWWEAGQFAAAEDDPISAGRLVHRALRYADAQGIGLVAAARTTQLADAYERLGFRPDPAHPPALVRRPAPLQEPTP
ncbi:hypothetical protein [Streptomyces sp. WM6378]|uniref:hypothetical protein n=1 Tax=Streptomyces sp. WM6378 TaxID=1415557 RepID=UPI0006AF8534|nr:hypothetical protein [Streptomyces sp. WM6378]KOU33640.1 hypothetical protein ADK54_41915 [Streptomyces sp. WM6378]